TENNLSSVRRPDGKKVGSGIKGKAGGNAALQIDQPDVCVSRLSLRVRDGGLVSIWRQARHAVRAHRNRNWRRLAGAAQPYKTVGFAPLAIHQHAGLRN